MWIIGGQARGSQARGKRGDGTMGLEKSFEDKYGNVNSKAYFRISEFHLNAAEKSARITLQGYKDIAAREALKAPIVMLEYSIETNIDTGDSTEFDTYFGTSVFEQGATNPIKQCYVYIKSINTWNDALDV